MKKRILLILALILTLCTTAIAHPGRTDDRGGHYDHDTGQYHYHHGYEAHQHTGGTCPFDFDDKTGENSGGASSGGLSSNSGSAISPSQPQEKPSSTFRDVFAFIFRNIPLILLVSLLFGPIILEFAHSLIIEPISKARIAKENARILDERRLAEYRHIHDMYYNKTRNEIARSCGMPHDLYIDGSNLPHSIQTKDSSDRCTVFVAKNGSAYHRNPRCCNRLLSPTNVVKVRHLNACRLCAPDRFDLRWYESFLKVINLMHKHGIEPAVEQDSNYDS